MKVLHQMGTKVRKEHLVQTIILLYTFRKKAGSSHRMPSDIQLLHKTIANISGHVSSLNIDEMSTCYLYLRKMGMGHDQTLMQELLMRSLREIETTEEIVGLAALCRLVVGINAGRDFHTHVVFTLH